MTFKRLLGIVGALCAVAVLTGSVGAGAARTPAKQAVNLSTKAAVKQYLRSIHVNPRGVVIQRGLRNYAGSSCPGAGWTCTSTSHPVVQVASTGGSNVFQCASSSCAVVQTAAAPLATNTAKCIKTTGISQSCSITQTSATKNNEAIVVQTAKKTSGLTQSASQTAQITQTATGGIDVANSNTACVLQTTTIDGSTVAKKGMPVTVTLDAHQSISIKQDSRFGGNTVKNAAEDGTCAGDTLTQDQKITSKASGSGAITQNENTAASGPNMLIDIEQNKSPGFESATGQNTSAFSQTSTLAAAAGTTAPSPPTGFLVTQAQSTSGGGLQANVDQFSHGLSMSTATQSESQCEHAEASATPAACDVVTHPQSPPDYTFKQTQYGPVRCCSEQADNEDDAFTINQTSVQSNDSGQNQTNSLEADCSTSGTCTATQNTDINGTPSSNTQTGSDVSIATTCSSGSGCTTTNDQSATSVSNTDVAEFGFGGMRGDGTGTITVGGVSGTVTKALLYWNGPTNSTVPTANAAVTFKGIPITGTNIGFASSNCWSPTFANSQSYRADVTSLVTGNGTYSLANFTKPDADINGVALIVFYDNGDTADDRNVVLFNGNDSNFASTFDPQGWDETIPNVPYPGSGSASLDFVVSDGQTATDDALVLNGNTLVPTGGIFQGTTLGGSFDANGSLWDVKSFDITSFLTQPSNDLHLTTGLATDCLSLVVAAANVPASAPIILSPLAAVLQRSQATEMQSTPAQSPRPGLARPSAQGSRALGGIASLPLRRGRSG
jgi:hypothetical protein